MEITRERFNPIMYLSATHISSADDCINFIRGYHLTIFRGYFCCTVRDMKIT
jgi:hypothetical protein